MRDIGLLALGAAWSENDIMAYNDSKWAIARVLSAKLILFERL